MRHTSFRFVLCVLTACLLATTAGAQSTAYQQTNLVSDMAGGATHTDPLLINPWGIAFLPGQPFWIATNNSGFSQQYDASGVAQAPASVKIPPPTGSSAAATPTGVVFNGTGEFASAAFIFATEDGTISTWTPTNNGNAVLALDHSAAGAVYKGLALLTPSCCAPFLAVANFHSGLVETYESGFALVAPPGSFTDPNLPAGFAPFNIQPIGNQVFVTYALQDGPKHDPVHGAGNGIVSVFNLDGTFVKRFASNGVLNAPWGVVQASANFGAFSNDILIGNFGDGTINAFDANGNPVGQLKDSTGAPIVNGSLWALVFGAGGTGDPNTLYFTAGLTNEQHGLFGAITVASSNGSVDFTVSGSPTTATVVAGQSTNFTITTTPMNGFAGAVSLSCAAPAGITCTFSPASVNVTNSPAMSTLTAAAAPRMGGGGGYSAHLGMFWVVGLGVLGAVGSAQRKRMPGLGVVLMLTLILTLAGCGSYNSSSTKPGPASITVTAKSGTVSHTTSLTLNVQ